MPTLQTNFLRQKGLKNFLSEEVLLFNMMQKAWKPVAKLLKKEFLKVQDKETLEILNPNADRILSSESIKIACKEAGEVLMDVAGVPISRSYRKPWTVFDAMTKKSGEILPTLLSEVESLLTAMMGMRFTERYELIADEADRLIQEILRKPDLRQIDLMTMRGRVEKMFGQEVWMSRSASVNTSRAYQFGSIDYYVEREIERYMIDEVMDDRTCGVCIHMHGKIFTIDRGVDARDQFLAEGASDDAAKELFPWPTVADVDNRSARDITENSPYVMPPYHPNCRGETIPI